MAEIDATPVERENSAQALKDLVARSDVAGLQHLAGHLTLLAVTSLMIMLAAGGIWIWPAMFLQGVLLVFLFAPLHETIHRTAFAARGLNDAVAFVIGIILILPREYFRAFHFAHHRHTQDPARDPELASPRPATRRQWLLYLSGLPYWYWQIRGLMTRAMGQVPEDFYGNDVQRQKVIAESRLILAIYITILIVSLILGSDAALRYWVLPVLLGQPMLRFYLLAEHWGCPFVPAPMLQRSRTTYTNAFVRFLAWNMPYHAEHHANPAVPFHALKRANALLAAEIGTTSPGYIAASRWIYERLT